MKAKTAVKGTSRIVVVYHAGQLEMGVTMALAVTDFNMDTADIDRWKSGMIEAGGACIYDGPPSGIILPEERNLK